MDVVDLDRFAGERNLRSLSTYRTDWRGEASIRFSMAHGPKESQMVNAKIVVKCMFFMIVPFLRLLKVNIEGLKSVDGFAHEQLAHAIKAIEYTNGKAGYHARNNSE